MLWRAEPSMLGWGKGSSVPLDARASRPARQPATKQPPYRFLPCHGQISLAFGVPCNVDAEGQS